MLVFKRRLGDEIIIGNSIRVVLVKLNGSWVKIGVSAPSFVGVDRLEIRQSIEADNRNTHQRPKPGLNGELDREQFGRMAHSALQQAGAFPGLAWQSLSPQDQEMCRVAGETMAGQMVDFVASA